MIYGYCRVSTPSQNVERQIRNIKAREPLAIIFQEKYTGTKRDGRREWLRLMKVVKPGDTIYFDSVSRMARNAEEGYEDYEILFRMNVRLIFLKEPHIDTDVYRQALEQKIQMTGTLTDIILEAVNRYIMEVARQQIRLAFEAAEREVMELRVKTREGMETARAHGKQIGQQPGRKLETKKSVAAKSLILKYAKEFGGPLNDTECIRYVGVARNTYYKYKAELRVEQNAGNMIAQATTEEGAQS